MRTIASIVAVLVFVAILFVGLWMSPAALDLTDRLAKRLGRSLLEGLYWIAVILLAIQVAITLFLHLILPSGRRFVITSGVIVTGIIAAVITSMIAPFQILEGFMRLHGRMGQGVVIPEKEGLQLDIGAQFGNPSSQWPVVFLVGILTVFYLLLCLIYFGVLMMEVHRYNVITGKQHLISAPNP
jgi:hypothetical protein